MISSGNGRHGRCVSVAHRYGAAMHALLAVAFHALAATPDGSAWVVGGDELSRIGPAGARDVIQEPVAGPLAAVAAAGDTVWVLGVDAIAHRTGGERWHAIDLPRSTMDVATITPLGGSRVLVLRACRNPPAGCTEAFVVDESSVVATFAFDWNLASAIADGRGGAWAIATLGYSTDEKVAYVHFDGAAWQSWSFHGAAIAGMTDQGKSPAFPHHAVAGDSGGFIGVDLYNVWWLSADGAVVRQARLSSDESFRNFPMCAITDDREVDVVFGQRFTDFHDAYPTAPVVVRLARATDAPLGKLEVDTPRWWRRSNESSTPPLRCAASAGVLWILTSEAIFRHDAHGWRTISARGAEDAAPDATQRLESAPIAIGASSASRPHAALSLRPELIVAPYGERPSFGFGGYAELAREGGATYLGAGVTAVRYHDNLGMALSAGVDERFGSGPQLVFSGFLGARGPQLFDLAPAETPFGIRFDARPATHDAPATFAVMLSIDAVGIAIAGIELGGLLTRHD